MLIEKGITHIEFVTDGVTSSFSLTDLLNMGADDQIITLVHDGDKVTFLLGEADISSILK